jgi:hypothetical protein
LLRAAKGKQDGPEKDQTDRHNSMPGVPQWLSDSA